MKNKSTEIGRNRVLVVEDDKELLGIMCDQLQSAGFDVSQATSASSAWALFESHDVSLVVLDWGLDASDEAGSEDRLGKSLLKRCRAMDASVPIIVISGLEAQFDVRTDAMMERADSYLRKPFSMALLVSHVSHLIACRMRVDHSGESFGVPCILPLDQLKRRYARHALAQFAGNLRLTAQALGIHRHTLSAIVKGQLRTDRDLIAAGPPRIASTGRVI